MKSGKRDQVISRGAHAVNGDHEVQAGKDGREIPADEDRESGFDEFLVLGEVRTEGSVERPTRIDAALSACSATSSRRRWMI